MSGYRSWNGRLCLRIIQGEIQAPQTSMNQTFQDGTPAEKRCEPRGWVLYDDSCGFCRRWIPFWRPALNKRGFEIAALQSAWVRENLRLSQAEVLTDLRLLLQNGQQVLGADVYRYLTKRIWWAYPVYLFSIAPLFRRLFNWGYRAFARNRFRFSRACGMQDRPIS
jgi:predicted DCC family thiol-disulfide oxidoreductase YuxK